MIDHIAGHLVRRGVQHLTSKQQHMQQLEHDAELYENAGPEMEVKPYEMAPVVITGLIGLFIVWSLSYTIGKVMSALTMIESPSRTAVIESKPPPPYTDSPDAPLEKEPLMSDEERDVEVSVIEHKPITSSIKNTIFHLHRVGGFRARWRGLGLSMLYHTLHGVFTNFLAAFLGFGLIGQALVHIFVSLGLARVHMAWTHKMIAYPSSKWWFQRLPARKDCKALLLPTLVYAAAQQATFILPIGVAFVLGVAGPPHGHINATSEHERCGQMALLGLRFLAVPLTFIVVGLAVLLPASVTLTRIEATLLPEGEATIVNFDKAAMMGEIDLSVRGGSRALFVQAWRSFDRASRLRLVKLYAKMVIAQVAVIFVFAHLMMAEVYLIGGERLSIFFHSARAQMKLMAIKAHQAHKAKAN